MDTSSRQLQDKFSAARALIQGLPLIIPDGKLIDKFISDLSSVEVNFALQTGHLFITATTGEAGRIRANQEFARLLAAEEYSVRVDRIVHAAETALKSAGFVARATATTKVSRRTQKSKVDRSTLPKPPAAACGTIQRLIDMYPVRGRDGIAAEGEIQRTNFERCPSCGGDMCVDATRSEMRCVGGGCGTIRALVGTVFDDSQFYSQEGQKAKSGTFNPNRHFQFWWMHILAREPDEEIGNKHNPDDLYGELLIANLREIVVRNRKVLRLLDVNDVRSMLREVGRTDLNKSVPLILKKLTGIGPPQASEALAVRVENIFTKAIEIGERVRRDGRVNRNYYPYYIYKILDSLLGEQDYASRRVLYYIYIQSRETVAADDSDWEQICEELPEITYVDTDRTKALRYRPI
jgi:hypothetical protein